MALPVSPPSTLARLSLWVRPERLPEFEEVYQKKLLPLIQPLGLAEADEASRPGRAGVFSQLFALEQPAQVAIKRAVLQKHPQWQEALRSLARDFGMGEALPYHWGVYRTRAGPGFRKGVWLSFGIRDGLSASAIVALFRDSSGNLWFSTVRGERAGTTGRNSRPSRLQTVWQEKLCSPYWRTGGGTCGSAPWVGA